MYKEIGDIIYNKIKLNNKFAEVWNYDKTSIEKLPFATISPEGSNNNYIDQIRFLGEYNYKIRIGLRNKDREIMENRIRILVDSVIEDLKDIPNSCDLNYLDFSTTFGWSNDEQPFRICEIIVTTKTLEKKQ